MSFGIVRCDRGFEKESGDGVDIAHHTAGAVKYFEVEGQEVLCPTAELVVRAVIGMDGFDCGTVGKPIKFMAPKILTESADSPATGCGFADEGVEMTFFLVTAARDEFDRT